MSVDITVVSGNRSKVAEIEGILGRPLLNEALDIAEIQSLDVEAVARDKAKKAYEILKRPVIVDDTGMSIPALGGLPGALVAWFLDSVGSEGILRLLGNLTERGASVSTSIGYADEKGVEVFTGTIYGVIPSEMQGDGGFGYDPIFIPDGETKTYAEMSSDEKNAISMRAIALGKLKIFLDNKE